MPTLRAIVHISSVKPESFQAALIGKRHMPSNGSLWGKKAWFSLFLFNGRKITINFTCLCFLQPTCDQVASLLLSCPLLESLLPFNRSTVSSSSVLHVWKAVACHKNVLYCKRGSCPLRQCDTDEILKFKLVITHQHRFIYNLNASVDTYVLYGLSVAKVYSFTGRFHVY